LILEATISLAFASALSLLLLKSAMVGLSSNQWTVMQTLTDAYLTRETALASRTPLADILGADSPWPDPESDVPPRNESTVDLGKIAGGNSVTGQLVRFRTNETSADDSSTGTAVYRLYSVLSYRVGGKDYYKTRTTLRTE
jgi:hypothetical protein